LRSLTELARRSVTRAVLARLIDCLYNVDVRDSATCIRCPTLLLHAKGDQRVPFEEGRLLASLIPGARLVPLDTANHVLLEGEPAFVRFFAELRAFLPPSAGAEDRRRLGELTGREAEILDCIARGLDNSGIAAQLGLSEKTVRNHITHVFDKLGVENRAQAIVLARRNGIGDSKPAAAR
jgi:DNA-binding CsgD family transcriptional regulator